ncbi:MAG: hypothetical protein K0Q72_4150 [Armatimonadetes bacterium]|jgi:hypothetical protein|nr:hypothetical protein [Armatimonadota bacterium]
MRGPLSAWVTNSYVRHCRRGWLQRTLQLRGAIETEIQVDGRPFGLGLARAVQVLVDGQVVSHWEPTSFGMNLKQTIELQLPHFPGESVLELSLGQLGLFQITYLKLTVGERVFYEEQRGTVLQLRASMPIPAAVPEAQPESLPIPAEPDLQ